MSTLYIVGTPIGNLGDFSSRGQAILREVDFIAAEDTRISRGLLTHFGITTPMISYHQHNQRGRGEQLVHRIQSGESCALITDAGMPAISDPGEDLVRLCAEAGIPVVVIPGPIAALSALAISGLPTRRFSFEGFLEGKPSEQRAQLEEIKPDCRTLIFYEAPHKLLPTLEMMLEVLGDRKIALCRELTKLYEEVRRTTLQTAISYYKEHPPRGEFVLILQGAEVSHTPQMSLDDAAAMVQERHRQGVPLAQAAKEVALVTGYSKNQLYQKTL